VSKQQVSDKLSVLDRSLAVPLPRSSLLHRVSPYDFFSWHRCGFSPLLLARLSSAAGDPLSQECGVAFGLPFIPERLDKLFCNLVAQVVGPTVLRQRAKGASQRGIPLAVLNVGKETTEN
jgi:hypothetical protein